MVSNLARHLAFLNNLFWASFKLVCPVIFLKCRWAKRHDDDVVDEAVTT